MSGLAILAWMDSLRPEVLSAPPLNHDLRPTPFNGLASFAGGVVMTVERCGSFVRLTVATEAGAIAISDLAPQDAATLGKVLLDIQLAAASGERR